MIGLVTLLGVSPVLAQIQPGTGAGTAAGSVSQGTGATGNFDGLAVTVKRVLPSPDAKGFMVVLALTETGEEARRATLMLPRPALVDEMGNTYQAVAVGGAMGTCGEFRRDSAPDCAYSHSQSFVDLPKGIEINFVLTMVPVDGQYSEATAALAQTASLSARVAVWTEGAGYGDATPTDLLIPNLTTP